MPVYCATRIGVPRGTILAASNVSDWLGPIVQCSTWNVGGNHYCDLRIAVPLSRFHTNVRRGTLAILIQRLTVRQLNCSHFNGIYRPDSEKGWAVYRRLLHSSVIRRCKLPLAPSHPVRQHPRIGLWDTNRLVPGKSGREAEGRNLGRPNEQRQRTIRGQEGVRKGKYRFEMLHGSEGY